MGSSEEEGGKEREREGKRKHKREAPLAACLDGIYACTSADTSNDHCQLAKPRN